MNPYSTGLANALASQLFIHPDGSATALIGTDLQRLALEDVAEKDPIIELLSVLPALERRMTLRIEEADQQFLVRVSMPFTSEWQARDAIASHLHCESRDSPVDQLMAGLFSLQHNLTEAAFQVASVSDVAV